MVRQDNAPTQVKLELSPILPRTDIEMRFTLTGACHLSVNDDLVKAQMLCIGALMQLAASHIRRPATLLSSCGSPTPYSQMSFIVSPAGIKDTGATCRAH